MFEHCPCSRRHDFACCNSLCRPLFVFSVSGHRVLQQFMSTAVHVADGRTSPVSALHVDLCPCSGRQHVAFCSTSCRPLSMYQTSRRRLLQQFMSTSVPVAGVRTSRVAAVDVDLCPCRERQDVACCSRLYQC